MYVMFRYALRFFLLMIGAFFMLSVLNSFLWSWLVEGRLYYSAGLNWGSADYLTPGSWVNEDYELVA